MTSSFNASSGETVDVARRGNSRICLHGPEGLSPGLVEIEELFPDRFTQEEDGTSVRFDRIEGQEFDLRIRNGVDGEITIEFSDVSAAFRGLGMVMGLLESGSGECGEICETRVFEHLGAMLDLSRNAVLRIDSLFRYVRHLALMGVNELLLYLEDTFEVPGIPEFGYFRGGYSQEELRTIDEYARRFGIEVVPCIQTLGHLEQVLQWPAFRKFRDTAGVLLAGDEQVDSWLEKIIRAASAPFQSRRIHIGMDEAHGVGSGLYRLKNGLRSPFDILCEHLEKTVSTCESLGLKPMIWSDMFFRLSSETNNYYDRESQVDPRVASRIPKEVDLVYWDYYHTDENFYDEWIERHRAMGKEPIFAAGIWTWNRFWAQLPFSIEAIGAGMRAARRKGLRHAFTTTWGDDGMECDLFSALPAMQVFANAGYSDVDGEYSVSEETGFLGSCDASFASWLVAGQLDCFPGDKTFEEANPSKWIFWHDPLLNYLDQQITEEAVQHFQKVADSMRRLEMRRSGDGRLEFMKRFSAVLAMKAELHRNLRRRYREGDRDYLVQLVSEKIPLMEEMIRALCQLHRKRWHQNYRSFGWEVLERRYVGLCSRFETLQCKLREHLRDPDSIVEELERPSYPMWDVAETNAVTLTYRQAATPSFIG